MIAAAARQASGFDVAIVLLAIALGIVGLAALAVVVVCGGLDDDQLPEFDDLEPPTTPRSLRP